MQTQTLHDGKKRPIDDQPQRQSHRWPEGHDQFGGEHEQADQDDALKHVSFYLAGGVL